MKKIHVAGLDKPHIIRTGNVLDAELGTGESVARSALLQLARFLGHPIPASAFFLMLALGANVAHAIVLKTSADDLRRLQLSESGLILVDVRDAKAFSDGHIQHARNILSNDILSANLPHSGPIVIYCSEDPCALTTSAAEKLISYGYKDVSILEGGFGAWLAKGYPAVSSTTPLHHKKSNTTHIDPDQVSQKEAAGQSLILDLRNKQEFAAGHIPNAKSVPLEELNEALAWLSKDKELVVYDRASKRSAQAAHKLKNAGFKVEELSGGLAAWIKGGHPLAIK